MSQAVDFPAGKREQTKILNRQAILDAAREAFSEMGYEAATVRDIIRGSGLAAGTFYNYFRSKEEVREALADDGARRFAPILMRLRAEAPDVESFVRAAIRAYFDFLAAEHAAWAARRPAGEAHHQGRAQSPEMAAVFAEVRAALSQALAGREGPAADSDYLAAACIAIAREVGEKMLERRPVDVAGASDFTIAMVLGGLRGVAGEA